jgi:hypothetical protein
LSGRKKRGRHGDAALKNKKMEEKGRRAGQLEEKENNLILGLLF